MSKNKDQQRLINTLETQLSWGPAHSWHNSMFKELSEMILDKCSVDLSVATLKRFFGTVKHDGAPSITTLDTLSQFAGYENWRSFKLSKRKQPWIEISQLPSKGIYLSTGFLAAFIVIVVIGTRRPATSVDYDSISFTSRPVTNSYPNSVVFDFDLKGMESDDMHIQQYWDPNKTITLQPGQTQATGIYYYPGYFRARLFIEGDTIKQHELFLKSNGWLGTVDYDPVPKYFTPDQDEGLVLSLPESIIEEIESSEKQLLSAYHYIDELGDIDADNFKLEAVIRTNYNDKWAVCQRAWIVVVTSKGVIFIPLSIAGCSSDNGIRISEKYIDGKNTDLSALSIDLSEYSTVIVESKQKNISISFDGETVYQLDYQEPLGRVVGLRFEFVGHGEVKSFDLIDQNMNRVAL